MRKWFITWSDFSSATHVENSMSVCLVTGGAGFLGSHLVEALVANDHVVRVVDNFTTGNAENLSEVMDDIDLHSGDCGNSGFLSKIMRGAELVFHLACGNYPEYGGDANTTLRVLAAARAERVRRVVFASCALVYGSGLQGPVDETAPLEPDTPLGRAKGNGEQACALYASQSGLETVRLRYFNVFGPRQSPTSPYATLVREVLGASLAGRSPALTIDEHLEQDLIYVDDAVHATLLAARAARVSGKVYNIARGQPTSCREIIDTVNDLLGTRIEPVSNGTHSARCLSTEANIRRAEVELGFCAATDLRRGLSRCLQDRTRRGTSSTAESLRPPHGSIRVAGVTGLV
jgi:nucleoside-diphosphate-sugar epimerase